MARLLPAISAACLAGLLAAGCSARNGPLYTANSAVPVPAAPLAYGEPTMLAAQNAPAETVQTAAVDGGAVVSEGMVDGQLAAEALDPVMAVNDPFEPLNRGFHDFNQTMDVVLARPVSELYVTLLPQFVRSGIINVVHNGENPRIFANYVLQGRPGRASETFMRFAINSTIGFGGLIDVAGQMGLERRPTDFGVTLARYGVPSGNYTVVPLLGPSTTRDGIGAAVDTVFSITFWAGLFTNGNQAAAAAAAVGAVRVINVRAQNDDLIENVIFTSPDSYTTEKSIFLQRRQARIRESDPNFVPDQEEVSALPDIP